MTHGAKVWTALVTVYVIWGSTYLVMRIVLETIPPFLMGASRFLTAFPPGVTVSRLGLVDAIDAVRSQLDNSPSST